MSLFHWTFHKLNWKYLNLNSPEKRKTNSSKTLNAHSILAASLQACAWALKTRSPRIFRETKPHHHFPCNRSSAFQSVTPFLSPNQVPTELWQFQHTQPIRVWDTQASRGTDATQMRQGRWQSRIFPLHWVTRTSRVPLTSFCKSNTAFKSPLSMLYPF